MKMKEFGPGGLSLAPTFGSANEIYPYCLSNGIRSDKVVI